MTPGSIMTIMHYDTAVGQHGKRAAVPTFRFRHHHNMTERLLTVKLKPQTKNLRNRRVLYVVCFCFPLSRRHHTCRKEFASLDMNFFLNGVEHLGF